MFLSRLYTISGGAGNTSRIRSELCNVVILCLTILWTFGSASLYVKTRGTLSFDFFVLYFRSSVLSSASAFVSCFSSSLFLYPRLVKCVLSVWYDSSVQHILLSRSPSPYGIASFVFHGWFELLCKRQSSQKFEPSVGSKCMKFHDYISKGIWLMVRKPIVDARPPTAHQIKSRVLQLG